MKKIILFALVLSIFSIKESVAQSITQQNLDYAIQSTENVQEEVAIANEAVNQLGKELTILGNPNATVFATKVNYHVNMVQDFVDEINNYIAIASNNSTVPFSTLEITSLANSLLSFNDELLVLINNMSTAINNGNTNTAINLLADFRTTLNAQNNTATNIINQIEVIKQTFNPFNVCIQAVDNNGHPTTYTAGFYCHNTTTGEYLYPDNQEGTCFTSLEPGNYTFDSYDDYFCGTSSKNITLSRSLENENGIIVVNLVVWCE